ncbi:MAG TPA: hypothetical protein VF911_17985, partial [Thermoanaerobaculia bacterium]
MNKALAIAAREVNDRRSTFATAALLAVLPYLLVLLPNASHSGRASVIAAAGTFIAVLFIFTLATILGASFVGRELSDKRLSFYFARPVPESAIWFGKLAGGLVTIFVASAIILVPTLLGSGSERQQIVTVLGDFALAALALFLVSHVVATMIRSRSMLIFADVIASAGAGLLAYFLRDVLLRGSAIGLVNTLQWSLAAVSLAIVIAAGAWQISRGRIDLRASHRELSRFLWTATALMLAVVGAFVLWVVSVTPDDLDTRIGTEQLPGTNWVLLAGTARNRGDYCAVFIKNVANGAVQRLDPQGGWWAEFSQQNGQMAGRVRDNGQLDIVHFNERDIDIRPTDVVVPPNAALVTSDDGNRMAAITRENVTVQSLPDGRTLAAARLPMMNPRAFFVTPDRLRIYVRAEKRVDIYELDVAAKRLTKTGTFADTEDLSFSVSPDGSRLLTRPWGVAAPPRVLDGRTGALIGTLTGTPKAHFGAILRDGRVAIIDVRNGRQVSVYSADLVLQRRIGAGGAGYVSMFQELDGGKIVVAGPAKQPRRGQPPPESMVQIIDVDRGTTVRTERDLRPALMDLFGYYDHDPRRTVLRSGAPLIGVDHTGK